jgi:large subunit ribosomal protein L3
MSQHTIGLIGRKVGMTQVFQPDGTMVAVSVVELTPNTVTRLRTSDRDGYTAIQLGAGERKKLTKPLAGQLKDLPRVRNIREFRLDDVDGYTVGQQLTVGDNYRRPGSIGPGTTPGRVYKGLKMSGHMGHERVTIKKLRVVRVDAERNLILVRGSVPGAPGALTFVRKA